MVLQMLYEYEIQCNKINISADKHNEEKKIIIRAWISKI